MRPVVIDGEEYVLVRKEQWDGIVAGIKISTAAASASPIRTP